MSTGLSIQVEDQRKVAILVAGGRSNSTADLVLSLWQQLRLLEGLVPSSLQVRASNISFHISNSSQNQLICNSSELSSVSSNIFHDLPLLPLW